MSFTARQVQNLNLFLSS